MELIVRDHVMAYFTQNELFSSKQYGFLKGRSTVLQLLHRWLVIKTWLWRSDWLYIMDFKKTFDKVPHRWLNSKLYLYRINKKTITWISDFLIKRQFRVVVNGKFSSWYDVLSGIRIFGPLLFIIIYINDLLDACNDLNTKLYIYADDTKLYRHTVFLPLEINMN